MTDHQFTANDRVYHRQLKRYGIYLMRDDLGKTTSHVEFDDDPDGFESRRITTAQLVPADEVTA
jgi:hypothetical protein